MQVVYTPPTKWQKFKSNKAAMAGMIWIVCCCLIVLFGALIRPDDSINANDQHLELACLRPGTKIQFYYPQGYSTTSALSKWLQGGVDQAKPSIPFDSYEIKDSSIVFHRIELGDDTTKTVFPNPMIGGDNADNELTKQVVVKTFWLGTDKYGRDVLSRLMAGTFISLAVGAIAVILSLVLGVTIGLMAGYYRGRIDAILMWFTNVIWSIPTLLLVMAITVVLGTGFWKVFLAVGLTMWVEVARITRGQVLSIREKEFVEAAKALGYNNTRIMWQHILPNITSPIIVISAANFASAILIEAGLSFLGLGAQIPVPSWGNMIREHYSFITTDMAFLALSPGMCIMLLVLAFMLVGNGLRDALDVKA
jgi:peptide/nickel transport system permease protein